MAEGYITTFGLETLRLAVAALASEELINRLAMPVTIFVFAATPVVSVVIVQEYIVNGENVLWFPWDFCFRYCKLCMGNPSRQPSYCTMYDAAYCAMATTIALLKYNLAIPD